MTYSTTSACLGREYIPRMAVRGNNFSKTLIVITMKFRFLINRLIVGRSPRCDTVFSDPGPDPERSRFVLRGERGKKISCFVGIGVDQKRSLYKTPKRMETENHKVNFFGETRGPA